MDGFGQGALVGESSPANYMEAKQAGQRMTLALRIDLQIKEAEERLAAMKRTREILDQQPQLEELLNIMNRFHF